MNILQIIPADPELWALFEPAEGSKEPVQIKVSCLALCQEEDGKIVTGMIADGDGFFEIIRDLKGFIGYTGSQAGFTSPRAPGVEASTSGAYMFESIEDFEQTVGYKTNEGFRDGWRMARVMLPIRNRSQL
jgi:hypothetical protein